MPLSRGMVTSAMMMSGCISLAARSKDAPVVDNADNLEVGMIQNATQSFDDNVVVVGQQQSPAFHFAFP